MSTIKLELNPELEKYYEDNKQQFIESGRQTKLSKKFEYFINLSGEIYRQVKSRKTLRVKLSKNYFIKIFKPISLSEILKNLLSLSWPFGSALDERDAILAVQKLNIKTLDIAGFGVKQQGIKNTSFLITQAIEPNISLDKFLEQKINQPQYFKLKRQLIKFIAVTTQRLHSHGLNHRDYYICHYLLKLNDGELLDNLYLIDLHRMQIRSRVPIRYIIKDLSGLLFSIRNYNFTKADYLRFIKFYNLQHDYRTNQKFWDKIVAKANGLKEKG